MKHQDIISQMTLEEKAAFCSGTDYWHTAALGRLDIPSILWCDGPHGIRKRVPPEGKNNPVGLKGVPAVCFPPACATACSWDTELLYEMGELLGEECLAENVSVLLGPGTNMKRSPLCGRNFDYFSEDPFLAGNLAASLINGIQSKGIGASLKHYAANNQETRRMTVNVVADERTLREIYLTAFEIAVRQAQPWTVMCMYNRLNGVYGAENKWLLTDVLRNEFGFKGMVVTDWGAENERVPGLLAGQNLEMPTSDGAGSKKIIDAVRSGEISEDRLDEMTDEVIDLILRAKKVLGHHTCNKAAHHNAARRIASQCMVLLKNDGGILPLKSGAKVAVIGQMAKKPRYQSAGSSLVNSIKVDSAYDELRTQGVSCVYADGYPLTKKERKTPAEKYLADAVAAAAGADTAVVFVGMTDAFESEGFDRTNLRMPPEHVALVNAVSSANKDLVVVLAGGSVIEMPWASQAKAILNSYLGGEGGGGAVADILTGRVCPSGKLAETYPLSLGDTPCCKYFPGRSATVEYREGIYIGYRYYDTAKKDVLFPFGHGLSYTSFEYSGIGLSSDDITDADSVSVTFRIKNTGSFDGAETAEVYVSQPGSTIFRPEKELKGFTKVFLKAGEEKSVTVELDKRSFAFYDVDIHDWHVGSGTYDVLVGASSRDIRLRAQIKVTSTSQAPVPDLRAALPDYYSGQVCAVSDEQFTTLLGHALPDREIHDYPHLTLANTIEDSAGGKNGAKICRLLKRVVGDEGMACSIALQTPVKNFVSMSMGVFSPEMAQKLLDVLNDREPLTAGVFRLLGKALPSVAKGLPKLLRSI